MIEGFQYRFVPAADPKLAPTLLLLHGTGGDENDMLPAGRALAPEANLLSPRGQVLENGMPRFFRRLADGVFDLEDLAVRSEELRRFVGAAATTQGFDPERVIAVGYSNGANIAASMLLRRPNPLAAAILLHPMTPFVPEAPPERMQTPVFISAGGNDPIVPVANTERLAALLKAAGADVTVHWHNARHSLTREELAVARDWLSART